MTAFLCVTKAASLDLLTDAAAYDPDGVVRRIASKACVLPHTRCVITGRGVLEVVRLFAYHASRLCFDYVIRDFDLIMAKVEAAAGWPHLGDGFFNHEILISGWSADRHRPEAYYAAAHGLFGTRSLSGAGLVMWTGGASQRLRIVVWGRHFARGDLRPGGRWPPGHGGNAQRANATRCD
jgi:hypothetical protein